MGSLVLAHWKLNAINNLYNTQIKHRDKSVLGGMLRGAQFYDDGELRGKLIFRQAINAFCFQLGISMPTLRSAFRSLEEQGYIQRHTTKRIRPPMWEINYADLNMDPPF